MKKANYNMKRWQSVLAGVLLILAASAHAAAPKWITLDWPTIALVFCGLLLMFITPDDLAKIFESIEFGKAKLSFRLSELNEIVNEAKSESKSEAEDQGVLDFRASEESQKHDVSGEKQRIDFLLSGDREMALIRIGVEIERKLAEMESGSLSAESAKPIVWSSTMRNLVRRGKISPQIATALTKFRNVRNQLIHPSGGRVPDAALGSAIDSGMSLLQLLTIGQGPVL